MSEAHGGAGGAAAGLGSLAVETHGLSRRFGLVEALRGVDLQIPRGSVFGLVGPNGAGKTTAFSLLCGFLRPTAGTVRVLGCDPRDRPALSGRVGALPQDAPLPARRRVLEVLRYLAELGGTPREGSREAAEAVLALVGMTRLGERRCGELSHGQAKRVSLAQAFLGRPELVLLDEPTSGLDPRSTREVKDILLSRRGALTLVISSHNLDQIEELCDAVAILDRGRLVRQGTLGEVTGQDEVVRVSLADDEADAAVEAMGRLPFVTGAVFHAPSRTLEVRIQGSAAEQAIPAILQAALGAGVRVLGVTRGRRLEDRVLELT